MGKGKSLVFVFLVSAAVSWGRAPIYEKVIYGGDGRLDLSEVADPLWLDAADSTVAFFRSNRILPVSPSPAPAMVKLVTGRFGDSMGLCTDEPFFNQRKGAFCSGALVGPDLVLTAGHCVDDEHDCESISLVFGWGIHEGMSAQSDVLPASEVYTCKEIVGAEREDDGSDWALIRLDRKVEGHEALPIAQRPMGEKDYIPVGTEVGVIGHPSGLPTKVTLGGTVRASVDRRFFTANTDTYGGNSGSPVLNALTGEIEGILVRGEEDFEFSIEDGCMRSKRCPEDGCHGEDVTRVSMAAAWIHSI